MKMFGGGGKSTGPSEEELARQRDAQASAEARRKEAEAKAAEEEGARLRGLRGRRALLSNGFKGFSLTSNSQLGGDGA